jgi:Cof subfamily protein (haloacid dehalogenase superfamily)
LAKDRKFIFIDIDGTIYDYKYGLVESAVEAVRKLKENGHHPILCTGRTRVMIFDEIINMDFDGIIAGAGSYISWKGEVISCLELPQEEVMRLVNIFQSNGFATYPEGHENFYYDPKYVEDGEDMIYRIYQMHIPDKLKPIDYVNNMHVSKVSAMYTKDSNAQGVIDALGDDYIWVDHSGYLLETIPKHLSKGCGVEKLLEVAGGSLENSYGFGDSYNDLDMLKLVKYGVVMGNGKDSLKKQVPYQTEPFNEDGVYNALVRFGLI